MPEGRQTQKRERAPHASLAPIRAEDSPAQKAERWRRRLQHVRVRTKIVVPMVILAVAPAMFVGIFTITSSGSSLREAAIRRVEFDAASKARAVQEFLQTAVEDVRILTQMGSLRDLAGVGSSGAAERMAVLRGVAEQDLLIFARGKRAYYQVRYLDGVGREVVRLNISDGRPTVLPPERLQDKSDRYYVQEALALAPGLIYISAMDLNIEHGRIEVPRCGVVRIAGSVRGSKGQERGLVVINIYADFILSLLGPLPHATEAWLVDDEGIYLGYVGESHERRDLYRLTNQRRLSSDFSEQEVSAILQPRSGRSVIDTGGAFLASARVVSDTGASNREWILLIAYPRAPIDIPIRRLTVLLSAVMAFTVAVAGALGILMGSYLARPIASLRRATRQIAAGDLSKHVQITTGDELEGLAGDFNAMTERLRDAHDRLSAWNEELEREVARQTDDLHRLQTGLARADKLASIGQMTAGVMHEVGNPLAAIKTKIQVAQEDGSLCTACRKLVEEILGEVDRLVMFLRSFSRLTRIGDVRMDEVWLADVVEGVETLVAAELRKRGMSMVVESDEDVPRIRGDAVQLRQLLINLILNAMEASRRGGEIRVNVRRQATTDPQDDRGAAVIEVVDRGVGIPEDIRARIWDQFFTTRPEGTGLGLSICRRIVEDHGGTIRIESQLGRGTVVRMTIGGQCR